MQTERGELILGSAIVPGHEVLLRAWNNRWFEVVSVQPDRVQGFLDITFVDHDHDDYHFTVTISADQQHRVRDTQERILGMLRRENAELHRMLGAMNDLFYQSEHIRLARFYFGEAGKLGHVLHCADPVCSATGQIKVDGKWWCSRHSRPSRRVKAAQELEVGDHFFWDNRILKVEKIDRPNPSELVIWAYVDIDGQAVLEDYRMGVNELVDIPTEQELEAWTKNTK